MAAFVGRGDLGGRTGLFDRHGRHDLLPHRVLAPPFTEFGLIQMQPMLLGPYDHAGSHEAHIGDDFVGGEAVCVDEVRTNEAACAPKASLAMHSDAALVGIDHFVREVDELSHKGQRWTGAVVKNHVEVGYPQRGEVGRRIELGVETHDEADVTRLKVLEDVFERRGERRVGDLLSCCGESGVKGRGGGNGGNRLVLGRGKGEERGGDPVEVAHVDALVHFVSRRFLVWRNHCDRVRLGEANSSRSKLL